MKEKASVQYNDWQGTCVGDEDYDSKIGYKITNYLSQHLNDEEYPVGIQINYNTANTSFSLKIYYRDDSKSTEEIFEKVIDNIDIHDFFKNFKRFEMIFKC